MVQKKSMAFFIRENTASKICFKFLTALTILNSHFQSIPEELKERNNAFILLNVRFKRELSFDVSLNDCF